MGTGEVNSHGSILDKEFGRIADTGNGRQHITGHDRARVDIDMIACGDIAVQLGAWGKSDKFADNAIMLDLGVKIGVKTAADADVRCRHRERRQAGAHFKDGLVHLHD